MRGLTTAVLALLFAGLATFYYVYEVRQGPARERATTEKDRLWKGVEAKDIDEVVLRRGAEVVHLRKTGEAWALVAPLAAKAEARPVEDLVMALAGTRLEREIEAQPAKLADFGLDPPAAEITVRTKGQERGLRLGAKNPTGTWVYAQEAGKPAVFLTSESLLREAQKGASDYRDRTVLAFERKDVRGLEVETAAGTLLAARLAGPESWEVTRPITGPGDAREIGGLLDRLRAARVKEFPAPPPRGPADYGLDRPLRLTLWIGEEKDRAARTLRLGKAVPDKKAVYAQREGDATWLLVDEELLKGIPISATALRDKSVFTYDRAKLERVELESPKGRVALTLDSGAWRITAPQSLRADDTAANALLEKARELRAREFVAEDARRLTAFGLDRPEVRLSVWEKDAKEPRRLSLAPGKEKDRAYATAGGPVVAVDAAALSDLARSVQDLRDRALFATFDARDVTRVEIRRGETVLALERKGESEWRLVQPKTGKARAGRVDDLVWGLRALKWKALVSEQDWEPARYGLDTPPATVTLLGKDGKTVAALALGRREAGDAFARVPGQPALYQIDARGLGDLAIAAEEWLL
jgi:hypothetical protein